MVRQLVSDELVSRILLRLIDEAILPAILLIGSKIVSMWFLTELFAVEWQLSVTAGASGVVFENRDAFVMINSYSNLFVLCVLAVGLFWILVHAYHLHDTHITPSLSLRLLTWNLAGLVSSSVDIFHKATVWLSYLWLFTFLLLVYTISGISYGWVTGIAFALSSFCTWLFISDLERELPV